jgi:hypothetical protein
MEDLSDILFLVTYYRIIIALNIIDITVKINFINLEDGLYERLRIHLPS